MNNSLKVLYIAQFMSAFADNAVLLIILGLLKLNGYSESELSLVSAAFFVPYILLSPFVGAFGDKNPKALVLLVGNMIKAFGVILLFLNDLGISLLMLSYFILGGGAACYSVAKYSILKELTHNEQELFRANGRLEAYTILAILLGIGCGGLMVDQVPLFLDIITCLGLYLSSLCITFFIPRVGGDKQVEYGKEFILFFHNVKTLWKLEKPRFSLIGTGSFWMSSAILRVAVLAWIPLGLGISSTDFKASLILATTSVGIIIGAILAPRLVPLSSFYRSLFFGVGMMVIILVFPWIHITFVSVLLLLVIGFMGGVYIIPQNTILQEEGTKLIGGGKTIAIQNLLENIFMLFGTGMYYSFIKVMSFSISFAILFTGVIFGFFILYLFIQFRIQSNRIG